MNSAILSRSTPVVPNNINNDARKGIDLIERVKLINPNEYATIGRVVSDKSLSKKGVFNVLYGLWKDYSVVRISLMGSNYYRCIFL